MFPSPSFLPLNVAPSESRKTSCAISLTERSLWPGSREAARVEKEGDSAVPEDRRNAPQVLEAHGLPASRVVRDRRHPERDAAFVVAAEGVEAVEVDVSFERMFGTRVLALRDHEVDGDAAVVFDVRARRVEVVVRRDRRAGLHRQGEEDAFGGAPLVRRHDVPLPGQLFDDRFELLEGARTGVRLVGDHHRGPLRGRHRRRPRIGQEIEGRRRSGKGEEVVVRRLELLDALVARKARDRFDDFDLERLDDDVRHGESPPVKGKGRAGAERAAWSVKSASGLRRRPVGREVNAPKAPRR
jgi:hypothetical protein